MISLYMQPFSEAELAYRRERITADYQNAQRLFHLKWPVGLLSPNRRRPHHPSGPRPSPHHAMSNG
jgi:hypothetical protein